MIMIIIIYIYCTCIFITTHNKTYMSDITFYIYSIYVVMWCHAVNIFVGGLRDNIEWQHNICHVVSMLNRPYWMNESKSIAIHRGDNF